MKRPLYALLLLSACAAPTAADYANPGDPERQLMVQTEITTLELESAASITELKRALKNDAPSRATLHCLPEEKLCKQALAAIKAAHVPYGISGQGSHVTFAHERVNAQDCDQRYHDNSQNPHNLNHKAFGCSVRANTLQMVGSKQQFINPGLLDYTDGEKAAQAYDKYLNPPEKTGENQSGGSSLIGGGSSQ